MTKHTRATKVPQTYGEHFRVAWRSSWKLIAYGLGGVVHAIVPEIRCLQFWTSSGVIRIYRELKESGRHDAEIERILK